VERRIGGLGPQCRWTVRDAARQVTLPVVHQHNQREMIIAADDVEVAIGVDVGRDRRNQCHGLV